MPTPWTTGNRIRLLENGEEFYPRLFQTVRRATYEVLVETFILADDDVGRDLQATLVEASNRGVRVDITVDGYGSSGLSPAFVDKLATAGVRIHVYDPAPTLFGVRTNLFRRNHRKLAVIDERIAFIGGINFSADHLRMAATCSKQDYAAEVEGPIVVDIRNLMRSTLGRSKSHASMAHSSHRELAPGTAEAMLVTRDNDRHRNDIELQYRIGARTAQKCLIVANAYFFPSYRLLRDIARAARRGVNVQLLLPETVDVAPMKWVVAAMYGYLARAGVTIYEYCERSFHGKVGVVDEEWATIGSSNLDPLSLSLNLEANLVIRDRAFNAHLRARLEHLMQHHCRVAPRDHVTKNGVWHQILTTLVFHVLRHFPAWSGLLPGHTRKVPLVTLTEMPTEGATEKNPVPD